MTPAAASAAVPCRAARRRRWRWRVAASAVALALARRGRVAGAAWRGGALGSGVAAALGWLDVCARSGAVYSRGALYRIDRDGAWARLCAAAGLLLWSSCAGAPPAGEDGGAVVIEVDEARPERRSASDETRKSPSKAPYWVTVDLEDEAAVVASLGVEATEESMHAYRAGMRALERGDYDAAVEHFVASHRKHPRTAQKWRIAYSLDKLGRWDEALLSYRWFLASKPGTAYVEHIETANERIVVLAQARPPAGASSPAPVSPADLAIARRSFQLGVVEFQNGSYRRARAAFLRAHALAPKPQMLVNIATCELRLNMIGRACQTYRRYLQSVGASASRSSQLDARCGP